MTGAKPSPTEASASGAIRRSILVAPSTSRVDLVGTPSLFSRNLGGQPPVAGKPLVQIVGIVDYNATDPDVGAAVTSKTKLFKGRLGQPRVSSSSRVRNFGRGLEGTFMLLSFAVAGTSHQHGTTREEVSVAHFVSCAMASAIRGAAYLWRQSA